MKKDFLLVTVIGVAVGLLIQPMLSTLRETLEGIGILVTPIFRVAILVVFAVIAPVALAVARSLGKKIPVIYQFAKFGAVGVLNTMIDFGVLNLIIAFSGIAAGVWFSVFKGFSFLVATTNSFVWNKFWTFGSKEKATAGQAAKFYLIAILGWIINVVVASIVVNVIPRPETILPNLWANVGALAGVLASFLWNFLGYKFFVFREQSANSMRTSSDTPPTAP